MPVQLPDRAGPLAALVLGVNPRIGRSMQTIGFAQLIASQIAGALATVEGRDREAAEMGRLRQLCEQSPSFIAVLKGPEHRFELVNQRYMR